MSSSVRTEKVKSCFHLPRVLSNFIKELNLGK